jgi:hypothetical protein
MNAVSAKPTGIIVLAWVHLLAGAAMVALSTVGGHGISMGGIVFGIIYFGFGFALRTWQPWALYLAIVLYVLSILGAAMQGEWLWALSLALLVAYLCRPTMREAYLSSNPDVEKLTITGETEVRPTGAKQTKGSPVFGLIVILAFVVTLAVGSYQRMQGWSVSKFEDYELRLAGPGLKIAESACGADHSYRVHGVVANANERYYELADEGDASKSMMILYSDKTSRQPRPSVGEHLTTTVYLDCGLGAMGAIESARGR